MRNIIGVTLPDVSRKLPTHQTILPTDPCVIFLGCHSQVQQKGVLKQWRFIISQLWGLEVQNQDVSGSMLSPRALGRNLLCLFWLMAVASNPLSCSNIISCLKLVASLLWVWVSISSSWKGISGGISTPESSPPSFPRYICKEHAPIHRHAALALDHPTPSPL